MKALAIFTIAMPIPLPRPRQRERDARWRQCRERAGRRQHIGPAMHVGGRNYVARADPRGGRHRAMDDGRWASSGQPAFLTSFAWLLAMIAPAFAISRHRALAGTFSTGIAAPRPVDIGIGERHDDEPFDAIGESRLCLCRIRLSAATHQAVMPWPGLRRAVAVFEQASHDERFLGVLQPRRLLQGACLRRTRLVAGNRR